MGLWELPRGYEGWQTSRGRTLKEREGIKRDWAPPPHSTSAGNQTPLERSDVVFRCPRQRGPQTVPAGTPMLAGCNRSSIGLLNPQSFGWAVRRQSRWLLATKDSRPRQTTSLENLGRIGKCLRPQPQADKRTHQEDLGYCLLYLMVTRRQKLSNI